MTIIRTESIRIVKINDRTREPNTPRETQESMAVPPFQTRGNLHAQLSRISRIECMPSIELCDGDDERRDRPEESDSSATVAATLAVVLLRGRSRHAVTPAIVQKSPTTSPPEREPIAL